MGYFPDDPQKHNSQGEVRVNPVVKGMTSNGKQQKGIIENLITGNTHEVVSYIVNETVEKIKELIVGGINIYLFGENVRMPGSKPSTNQSTSYDRFYKLNNGYSAGRTQMKNAAESTFDGEVLVDSRGKYELVMENMNDIIERYGRVSMAQFHEFCGIPSNHTERNYGWTNLNGSTYYRTYDEDGNLRYGFRLPRTTPIDPI